MDREMSEGLKKIAKLAHRVTQAETEARIKEIAEALENAGAAPTAGWDVTLEDIASTMYYSDFGVRITPRKSATFDEEDKRRIVEMHRIVGALQDIDLTDLSAIRKMFEEKQASDLTKDWYTVAEAAKLTKHKPYTVRQACNLGRIRDDWKRKERSGKWWIHRDAITWIQNHGLPPVS